MRTQRIQQMGATMSKFILLAAMAVSFQASAFVNEGNYEITADGDFNGDGLMDVVIVDRPSGVFRVGFQTAANTYNWSDPLASGVESVDGVSVGKLFQTTRDGIAIVSSLANRVNMFDVPSITAPAVPFSVFSPGIGPNVVIAINIPGAGDTAHSDLMIGSNQNTPANPGHVDLVRNNAGATSLINDTIYPDLRNGNRFLFKKAATEYAGAMDPAGASDIFRAFLPSTAGVNLSNTLAGVARNARFINGNFNGTLLNHLIFYVPLQATFVSHPAQEPVANSFTIGAGSSFTFPKALSQLVVLPGGASADRLMAIFDDGTAGVYSFNGAAAPVLIQAITADPGERVTAALPIAANNNFIVMFGSGNVSTSGKVGKVSGGGYALGSKFGLPAVTPMSGDANIFLFNTEPFVSTQPGLLRSVNSGDWTSDFAIVPGAPNTFTANVWNFESSSLGLRNPVTINFGAVAPTTGFGLVNQFLPSISLFSRTPAVGNEVVEVKITPEPGEFRKAIAVSLSSPLPGAQLWYRLGTIGGWTLYSSPFTLFRNTTVQYYGNPLGSTTKSRIRTGDYVFPTNPGVQDSDKDGVPDYVEIGKGLNPNGGKDQDGDGYTDFNELVAGTNPLLVASVPTDAQRLEEKSAFDLYLGLQPLDGISAAPTTAALGVNLRSYDLHGSILRASVSSNLGVATVTDPAEKQTNIVLSTDPPLIVVGTDPHFDISTASPDKTIGREMVGLIQVPRPAQPQVAYVFGGGALATEANNWVASAQALYAAIPREQVKGNLDISDTLTALMFEGTLIQIVQQHEGILMSNVTLFPFRPTDSGRSNPPATLLTKLETQIDDAHKGYKLQNVFSSLESMVGSNLPAGMNQLKALTTEIYRISSASNNISPAKYPSPVDVLRAFLETGVLHSNYFAAVVAPIDLTAALNAYNTAKSNVTARPTVAMDLIVRADTFGGTCTRLDTAVLPAVQKTLVHAGGSQYRLLESFNLLPGTQISVFGYTDAVNPACAGADAIEVISIALETVPETTAVDLDGDLLLDALEFLLFGSLSNTGFSDFDGDGYSNLQEILDGSDPADLGAHGVAIVNLSPPALSITKTGLGDIVLNFSFPASYMDDFHFTVKSSNAIGLGWVNEAIAPINIGGNNFQVTLPNPGTNAKFYQLSMALN